VFGIVVSGVEFQASAAETLRLVGTARMAIRGFLNGYSFDPEAVRIIGIAFEMTRAAVRVAGRTDLTEETIAKRIIELAEAGERNADVLCEAALYAGPVATPHPRSASSP
jgi:hypothetical protein